MFGTWEVVRFIHILAASLWVGGLVVLSLLVIPLANERLESSTAKPLVADAGRRFGFVLIGVLVPVQAITGMALIWNSGVDVSDLAETPYGRTLIAKLAVVAAVLVFGALHGYATSQGYSALSRVLAIGTVAGSIVILLLAAALVP